MVHTGVCLLQSAPANSKACEAAVERGMCFVCTAGCHRHHTTAACCQSCTRRTAASPMSLVHSRLPAARSRPANHCLRPAPAPLLTAPEPSVLAEAGCIVCEVVQEPPLACLLTVPEPSVLAEAGCIFKTWCTSSKPSDSPQAKHAGEPGVLQFCWRPGRLCVLLFALHA